MTHPAIGRIACRPTRTDATREGNPVRAALTTPHRAARVLLSLVPAALLAVALAPDRAVSAQQVQAPVPGALAALGSPPNPRVPMHWDRFYDHKGIGEILHRIAAAWPDRARVSSIGKSVQGRDIWMITVTNFNHGDPDRKPAMYIDGNIHSNEIQGSEFALYTAWYLAEMADEVPAILKTRADTSDALMARIAEQNADRVVVTDDNPRGEDGDAIVAGIMAGFAAPAAVQVQRDRAAAIAAAIAGSGPQDVVLVAGKGHEPYQEVAGVRHAFDDTAVAGAALDAWAAEVGA